MENIKMTNKLALDYVLNTYTDLPTDVAEKITSMRDSLVKKASAPRKATKTQLGFPELMEAIYQYMANEQTLLSPTEIFKANVHPGLTSVQKVTSVLTRLTEDGRVVKEVSKGKSFYKAVVGE